MLHGNINANLSKLKMTTLDVSNVCFKLSLCASHTEWERHNGKTMPPILHENAKAQTCFPWCTGTQKRKFKSVEHVFVRVFELLALNMLKKIKIRDSRCRGVAEAVCGND